MAPSPGSASPLTPPLKLLLDEMWPPTVAVELRRRGHDVSAVSERADLRGQPDDVVFAAAQLEGRAVVTENVVDYRPIAEAWRQRGSDHAGMIFTSNRRFPRRDARTIGRLIVGLEKLFAAEQDLAGQEHWLA